MLSTIKNRLVPAGKAPYRVATGPLRGLRFNVDLQSHFGRAAGLYEREVAGTLRRFSRSIHTAIDVGASDGWYTLYFLQRTKACVIAFEAQWGDTMRPNLAVNGVDLSRLTLRKEWVGEGSGYTTLDSLAGELSYPVIVKVDVDGGEVGVLHSATKLMHPSQAHWIIETHSLELENECIAWLRRFGYEPRVIDNAWWRDIIGEQRVGHCRWLVAH